MAVSTVPQTSLVVNPPSLPTFADLYYDKDTEEWALVDTFGYLYFGATPAACQASFLEALRVMADHVRKCPYDAALLAQEA